MSQALEAYVVSGGVPARKVRVIPPAPAIEPVSAHELRTGRGETALGYARAMNLALAACDGRYVALMNSDGTPGPGMLHRLAEVLDGRPDAIWAAHAVHAPGEPNHPPGPVHEEGELPGMALLIRREAFLALGLFDPLHWFYSEDYDASLRARAAGWTLLRAPDVVFHHGKGGRSSGGGALRELLFAATYQTHVHHRSSSQATAARRVAGIRSRSLAHDRGDPFAVTGLVGATALWPASVVAAKRRRRRPWDAAQLGAWLGRQEPRVERTRLGSRAG